MGKMYSRGEDEQQRVKVRDDGWKGNSTIIKNCHMAVTCACMHFSVYTYIYTPSDISFRTSFTAKKNM